MLRFALIVVVLALSWLWMMIVHELGHVIGAWLTGGTVAHVALGPLQISRTDLATNPRPLLVVWAGPLFGSIAPLAVWLIARAAKLPGAHLLRFFAGFCLVANGAYIGCGPFMRAGDAADMLRHGSAAWQLYLFGVPCIIAGVAIWHRLGPQFGLGASARTVGARQVIAVVALLVATVIAEGLMAR